MFGILNFDHCDLPFDSFDLEALDRLAQGGESFDFAQDRESIDVAQDRELVERPVERLVEPFGICDLLFEFFFLKPEHRHLKPYASDNMLSEKMA